MSKRNQSRALTLQETLTSVQIRERALAEIVYFLLPREQAHGIITTVFAAIEAAPTSDLRAAIHGALEEWDKTQGK